MILLIIFRLIDPFQQIFQLSTQTFATLVAWLISPTVGLFRVLGLPENGSKMESLIYEQSCCHARDPEHWQLQRLSE